jgi:hypothetical protein
MKYLLKYKLFESSLNNLIPYADIQEYIIDTNIDISEELGVGKQEIHLSIGSNTFISNLLEIDNFSNDFYTLSLNRYYENHKVVNNNISRLCKYLSSRYDKQITYDIIGHKYIIGYREVIDILAWLYDNEFRNDDIDFNYLMYDMDEDSIFFKKYQTLLDFGVTFGSSILSGGYSGFSISVKYNNENLGYLFKRVKIGEDIEYNLEIFTYPGTKRSHRLNLESSKLTFNIYDKDFPEKICEIVIGRSIKYFKIDKLILIDKIVGILSEENDFFNPIDIDIRKGLMEFLVKKDDDFARFRISIEDNLDMYVKQLYPFQISSREQDKTSVDELIHDVYLKLTQKNAR